MKKGIFIAIAALALAVFAVPEAYSDTGPAVDQRLSGSILEIDVDEDAGNTKSLVTGIAKGQPGGAQVTAVLVFETEFVFDPESDCPPDFPLEADVISFEWGEVYDDGSVLAGAATEGQLVCLNLDATLAVADVTGTITGGTGRFEGASGSPWRLEASAPTGSNTATGTLTVDLH